MAQIVDLGCHSFKTDCLRGQCLVSRATATLTRSDSTNATEPTDHKLDFQNAWITLKQELIVDLYMGADSNPVTSMPCFVKQVVETVQASLVSDSPYLQISTVHHEYRRLSGPMVLHISIVLRKVPDLSPRILPRRLPRKVKECAAEPHPPSGITRATLSHVAVYMKTIRQYTPWSLFLTNLWLKQPHSHEQDTSANQRSNVIILRPPRSRPLLASCEAADTLLGHSHYLASGDEYVQRANIYSAHDDIGSVRRHTSLSELVDRSLQCLVNTDKQQYKGLINKQTIEEGPSLSDVAPASFKPGHYENIRQRAGLIPVVTRSMARIFRACQSSSAKEKMSFVKSNLRVRYENCTDTERTESGHLSRSLIKCVVWTALQRGAYKVEWPKNTTNEDSDMILLTDDDLLTQASDQYDDLDGQMLSSSIRSATGSDDILSHCNDDIEPDSGYSSLSSPEKLFSGSLVHDSLYDEIRDQSTSEESAIDDDESYLVARPDTEGKYIIRSSSIPLVASDACADNDATSDPFFSSQALSPDDLDVCVAQHDEDMMDGASSMSIISSSTYQYIPEDLKGKPEVKLEYHERGDDLTTI